MRGDTHLDTHYNPPSVYQQTQLSSIRTTTGTLVSARRRRVDGQQQLVLHNILLTKTKRSLCAVLVSYCG